MKLKAAALAGFCLSAFFSVGQRVKFGAEEEMLRKMTSSVVNNVGVFNNQYHFIERDFGGVMDMKNNIQTNVRSYNVSNLNSRGATNINLLIAGEQDQDKFMFADVFQWGNKVVGFYTHAGSNARKTVPFFGQFYDIKFKPVGKPVEIGDFAHGPARPGLLVDGRAKLNVVNEFYFRMSPDSGKLLVMFPSQSEGFNVLFKIFDKDLKQLKNITATIPIKTKTASIAQFLLADNGMIFLLTKGYKSKDQRREESDDDDYITELYSIDPNNNNEVHFINLNPAGSGRSITRPTMNLDAHGNICVVAMYHDMKAKEEKTLQGIFTIKINTQSGELSVPDVKDFSNELLAKFMSEKQIKKQEGYKFNGFELSDFVLRPDGGMYAMGQSKGLRIERHGRTGALDQYYEVYGNIILCYINADGRIVWIDGLADSRGENYQFATVFSGIKGFYRNNGFHIVHLGDNGLKKKELKAGINISLYDDAGKSTKKFFEFPEQLENYAMVPGTFSKVNDKSYMFSLYLNPFSKGFKRQMLTVGKIEF